MLFTLTVNNNYVQGHILPAVEADIPSLVVLNQKWQLSNLQNKTANGFLGGSFNAEAFEYIIKQREIVVAKVGGQVVAYMLSIHHLPFPILQEHAQMAQKLKDTQIIPAQSRVAIGIQTAVEEAFHGTGLIVQVRKAFMLHMKASYQYFFTTISLNNTKSYKSATNFGWQVFGMNDHHYYLYMKL